MSLFSDLRQWARKLKSDLVTLWFCQKHPDTPLAARALSVLVVAYAFSPIDLIPDFIPVLGYLDDVVILPVGIYLALRLIPGHVKAESRVKAAEWQEAQNHRPRNWPAAAVIIFLWALLMYWGWRWAQSYL